jgi:hypothetical protein
MTATTQLLTGDHIDLLITAALRWRVLTNATTAAFTRAERHLVVATATETARILQQENLAALRWLSDRGRTRLADRAVPDPHVFREVDALDPVEVIKACHAYQHLCSSAPGWSGSTAHRLVAAISTAATHRLSGYAEAPWIWSRPQIRAGHPVALGRQWRPDLPGISWVDVAGLIEVWQSASLIVVTTEAAADLPGGLPARGGVFLLASSDPPDQVWDAVAAVSPEAVLYWPVCDPWLAEQVRDPSSKFTHHRDGGPA